MRISRADRSILADWWFTVDRMLLCAIMILIAIGVVLSLAASPSVAVRQGFGTYHYVERHAVFAVLGSLVIIVLSFLSPSVLRRVALFILTVMLGCLLWVVVAGQDIHGARRWIELFGYSFQPSEFVKPGLVVMLAWLFAESRRRNDMPALPVAIALGVIVVGLVAVQPDLGQAFLMSALWLALYLLSGQSLLGGAVIVALLAIGSVAAYFVFDHVQLRVDAFLSATVSENSQVSRAMESFVSGGFFGRGPGEGTIKTNFPDAHNDFIFSVVAEEYGVLACLALLALYAFIVLRSFIAAEREPRAANRLAIQGLALVFGLQALINMGVNAGLLPTKGMTLPFISAGGSSMLAISITLGMLIAFMRKRVDPFSLAGERPSTDRYVVPAGRR